MPHHQAQIHIFAHFLGCEAPNKPLTSLYESQIMTRAKMQMEISPYPSAFSRKLTRVWLTPVNVEPSGCLKNCELANSITKTVKWYLLFWEKEDVMLFSKEIRKTSQTVRYWTSSFSMLYMKGSRPRWLFPRWPQFDDARGKCGIPVLSNFLFCFKNQFAYFNWACQTLFRIFRWEIMWIWNFLWEVF